MGQHNRGAEVSKFQGVDRLVLIIDVVKNEGPINLAQISRATGLTEPTALRYLNALRHHRLIRKDEQSGSYFLGMKLFEWGESAQGAYDPKKIAAPFLDHISQLFGETVEIAGRESDDRLVVLDARAGLHGVSKLAVIGEEEWWHATSVGKALLAQLDEEEVLRILSKYSLKKFTERTFLTISELIAELERTKIRGYAIDNEESELGLRCVGIPIRDRKGQPMYSMSVSGPSYRMTDEKIAEIAQALREAVTGLESAWGFEQHHKSTKFDAHISLKVTERE